VSKDTINDHQLIFDIAEITCHL